ncbi:MAG: arginine N-succinyltransferase [Neptuniibacter sp.]
MYYIRPIAESDLDTLFEIAVESGPGFTSLPENQELLRSKIALSLEALSNNITHKGPESYLFVLVDSESGEVVGTTGIEAAVGMKDPWYHYRVGTVVHASRELKIHNQFKTLYLCNDYTGCSEVCTLYLKPEHRHSQNGSLLSKSRFLFMAEYPQRFSERVIAEMRGFSDAEGRSPFWEGLGRHFFSMDYSRADYLTGSGNKAFIAELMPKYTIYLHLLPEEAQQVIGKVHANTEPARKMLEHEGFRFENYVDIFDAGPTITAPLQKIRAIRESRYAKVRISKEVKPPTQDNLFIVSNTRSAEYRCCLCNLTEQQGITTLDSQSADALKVQEGDTIRIVELKPKRP